MQRTYSVVICSLALVLLIGAVALAERAVAMTAEIPAALFFGIPLAAAAITMISLKQIWRLKHTAQRYKVICTAAAVVLGILPMIILNDHYRGDYDPLVGRIAPDGSAVTSITWSKNGPRYIERLNNQFESELTEQQYQAILVRHQRALLSGIIGFASLGFLTALVYLLLEKGFLRNGS